MSPDVFPATGIAGSRKTNASVRTSSVSARTGVDKAPIPSPMAEAPTSRSRRLNRTIASLMAVSVRLRWSLPDLRPEREQVTCKHIEGHQHNDRGENDVERAALRRQ